MNCLSSQQNGVASGRFTSALPKALLLSALIVATSVPSFGCWQTFESSIEVRGKNLVVVITDHGKPIGKAEIELREAIPRTGQAFDPSALLPDFLRPQNTDTWERPWREKVLARGITDENGRVDFGPLDPGEYYLAISGDPILPLKLLNVTSKTKSQLLRVNFFLDGCIEPSVSNN